MGAAAQAGSETVCPLGVCDGSGWILGPEDVARPCECRERRVSRARSRGVASVIPAKYRGLGFERPPITELDATVVGVVREYVERLDPNTPLGMKGLAEGGVMGASAAISNAVADALAPLGADAGRQPFTARHAKLLVY